MTAGVVDRQPGRSAVSGAGWLGAGAVVVKTSQTLVLLLLAALLAPEAIGVIAIGALVLNVTAAFTDLGTSVALVHWRGDAERAARSALTLALALALAMTATLWVAAPFLAEILNAGDLGVDVIRGMVLCLPFTAVGTVSQELLRRALEFRRRVLPDIAGSLAGAALTVGLTVHGHGAMSLVYGQLLQAVLTMPSRR
jgi:O-antigen/teichoic acid export membrane protein